MHPFPQGLVDPKQYYDVLQVWLYPMPEGIDVQWYPSASDETRGIVGISISRQPPDRWPCVITKVLDASGKASGASIAYVELGEQNHGRHPVRQSAGVGRIYILVCHARPAGLRRAHAASSEDGPVRIDAGEYEC